MRKDRWVIIPAIVATLCALLFAWLVLRFDQPAYNGKPLIRWLMQHAHAVELNDKQKIAEVEAAIRNIGTNAFPTILAWVSKVDSGPKKKLVSVVGNKREAVHLFAATDYHAFATYTCGVLKEQAKPIVPDLAARLRHTDPFVRSAAAFALDRIGPAAEEAAPALLEALADREAMDNAMQALKTIGVAPERIVQSAVTRLSSTNTDEQLCAMWALAQCGTNASVAVSNVTPLLRHPDLGVRMSATNTLDQIEPQ